MDFLVHHMLRSSASRSPDKEAIVFRDQRLTFREFHEKVSRYAATLVQSGCQRRDRIGVLLPPGIPLAATVFSVSMADGIFVPIHHSLFEHQVQHIVQDCGINTLITCKSLLGKVPSTLTDSDLQLILTDAPDELDESSESEKFMHFETGTTPQPQSLPGLEREHNRTENDLAAILYTSGSTGLPKGVMLSHRNVVAGASIVSEYLGINSSDRILAALPFSFDAGLNQLTTSIQQGACIVLLNFMFAREIVAAMNKERITGLAGVPPLWNLLVQENSTLKKNPPQSLRYVTNTGGAVTSELLRRMQDNLPNTTDIVLMYGLTEAFRSTYLPPAELSNRPESMGKAIPNTEIMVVDENGKRCQPHETGELVHAGPTVALGYWGKPEATAKVFRPHPQPVPGSALEEKVVFSGDLVYSDLEGYFYFVGRKDSQIKSSGFRISPTEVEAGLMQTGDITQAAVVGIADPTLGQKVIAFVSPRDQESFKEPDLLVGLAEYLPRHMLPKAVYRLEEFPKTSSGKIDYKNLKTRAEELADKEGANE